METKSKTYTRKHKINDDGYYLSELLDAEELADQTKEKPQRPIAIDAPVGSGKTQLSIQFLKACSGDFNRSLFLLDTSAGVDRLVNDLNEEGFTQFYTLKGEDLKEIISGEYHKNAEEWNGEFVFTQPNKILILTFASFGLLIKRLKKDLPKGKKLKLEDYFKGLVVDEFHNLAIYHQYSNYREDALVGVARNILTTPYSLNIPRIYLTATWGDPYLDDEETEPNIKNDTFIIKEFSEFLSIDNLKRLQDAYTTYFKDIKDIYSNIADHVLKEGIKGVIFTEKITSMENIKKALIKKGLTVDCVWSINNLDYPMDQESLNVREQLLNKKTFNADILIINKAYETSIEIKDPNVDLFVSNSVNEISTIQSRGRIRDHLLYAYHLNHSPKSQQRKDFEYGLSDYYLNRPLVKAEVNEIIKGLNMRDSQNHLLKFPSIKEYYEKLGYVVTSKRQTVNGNKKTYYYFNK